MSDIGSGSSTLPESDSNRPQLYKLIFEQNLDEVHLLIDFVSGRAERSLTNLTIPGADQSSPAMTSREIIQAVAAMRFPPAGPDAVNANNAALLLLAKDRLSALAEPATGLTIAYTAMFIDAEVKTWPRHLLDWTIGLFKRRHGARNRVENAQRQETATVYAPDQRVDLAARAFPVLQDHARRFRHWRDGLAWFSVVWLLLTAIAYWDAGLGRVALERVDQNWKVFVDQLRDDPTLLACDERPLLKPGTDSKVSQDAAHAELDCRRHAYQRWKGEAAVKEIQNVFRCEQMSAASKIFHVWCWHWILTRHDPELRKNTEKAQHDTTSVQAQAQVQTQAQAQAQDTVDHRLPPKREPSQEIKNNATYWQTATSRLTVFTTYVLPMMFALLGTLISSFRTIINRVRDSTLAPRDLVRMLLGVPTGLVSGVAVGLFLSPSSVPLEGAGGVAGQSSLTPIGLGFLAGYASQSFFNYLDTIVATVFPPVAPATAVAAAPPAARAAGRS